MKFISAILIWIIFQSCTSTREAIMPFRNYAYSGERLFPIQENRAETIFRIWFNNGTSVDRVITISRDTLFNDQGIYIEFGTIEKKGVFGEKDKPIYNYSKIVPKSGFDNFFKKLDSLDIIDLKNQKDFEFALHEVFSLYVIEYKKSGKYNQFNFRTHLKKSSEVDIYSAIEKIIFKEFDWNYYFK